MPLKRQHAKADRNQGNSLNPCSEQIQGILSFLHSGHTPQRSWRPVDGLNLGAWPEALV